MPSPALPSVCPACAAPAGPGDQFCTACGASLADPRQAPAPAQPKSQSAWAQEEKLLQLAEEREERRAAIRERHRASRLAHASAGIALLSWIENPAYRVLAIIAAIVAPVLFIALSPPFSNGQIIGLGLLAALFSLFIPGSNMRSWRSSSDDRSGGFGSPRRPPGRGRE